MVRFQYAAKFSGRNLELQEQWKKELLVLKISISGVLIGSKWKREIEATDFDTEAPMHDERNSG